MIAQLYFLPFPVSVYGQTFNSANLSSNGALDLIGTAGALHPWLSALPNTLWNMAIFPYQDDLRTDANFPDAPASLAQPVAFSPQSRAPRLTGSLTLSGARCTLPTPLRQPTSQWCSTRTNQASLTSSMAQRPTAALMKPAACKQAPLGPATTFSCGTATLTSGLKVTYTCAGGGGSPTPTPTATGTPGGCQINGSLDGNDPTQTDRLFRSGIPQTCPAGTTCAIFGDPTPRHYDSYTFTNTTGAPQCVTVTTTTDCTGTNFTFTAAYLGSFDPNNLCNNWIGDGGSSPDIGVPISFSFDVADGDTFVVVISEVTPNSGCPAYTIDITPQSICGGGASPTPTATCVPAGPGAGAGAWTAASPYPLNLVRYGFAQTATHFYVFGGVADGTRVNNVNRYNLATGMWEPRASMPFASEAPTCALMESTGIVYCAEGDTGNGFASYNIATDTWTPLAADPFVTDHYGSASGAFNGKVFVVGGTTGFSAGNWVYDVGTNTWALGTSAPDNFLLAGYQQVGQLPVSGRRLDGWCAYGINHHAASGHDFSPWGMGKWTSVPYG